MDVFPYSYYYSSYCTNSARHISDKHHKAQCSNNTLFSYLVRCLNHLTNGLHSGSNLVVSQRPVPFLVLFIPANQFKLPIFTTKQASTDVAYVNCYAFHVFTFLFKYVVADAVASLQAPTKY